MDVYLEQKIAYVFVYTVHVLFINQFILCKYPVSHFGHKVIPHAELRGNEFLLVGGPFYRDGRRCGRSLFNRTSRNKHAHVKPASLSVHILSGRSWGR